MLIFVICEERELIQIAIISCFPFIYFVFPATELRNDHKGITEKINQNIQLLHSAKLTPMKASFTDSG